MNDLHGTYAGNVTLNQPGAILADSDTSAQFDGSTGYVDVAPDNRLNKLTNNFTIEAWVREYEETVNGIIVSNKGSYSGYALAIDPNVPRINLAIFGKKDYVFAPFSFPDNQWTYLAVVFDSSNDAHFYINGELERTVGGSNPASTNSQTFNIGRAPLPDSLGSYRHFNGGLDEVAIYGRSLAPEEINEHYLAAVTELFDVSIDIKPGNDTNSIKLGSNGNIAVAIFSTDVFDATTVDPATIMLADAGVKARGKKGDLMSSFEDVDGDGLLDLLVHIDTQGLVLNDDDVEALLTGETFDGLSISGTDAIRLVGSSGGLSIDAFTSETTPLLAASAVPEPSTITLLFMGAIGLAVFARRKDPTKRT